MGVSLRFINVGIISVFFVLFGTSRVEGEEEDAKLSLRAQRLQVYIEALQLSHKKKKLKRVLEREIPRTQNISLLTKYTKVAIDQDFSEISEVGLNRLYRLAPNNYNVMKELAIIYYQTKRYKASLKLLEIVNLRKVGDYLTHFYQGEILHMQKKERLAKQYYTRALELLHRFPVKNSSLLMTEATLYLRLKNKARAEEIYNESMARFPKEYFIRLTYISYLLDERRYRDVKKLLAVFPKDVFDENEAFFSSMDDVTKQELQQQIAIAQIRYIYHTWHRYEVYGRLKKLRKHYPKGLSVVLLDSDIASQYQNWRHQEECLEAAVRLAPRDEILSESKESLNREHGSFIKTSAAFKVNEDENISSIRNYEYIWKNEIKLKLSDSYRLGVVDTLNYNRSKNIPKYNGDIHNPHQFSHKNELYLEGDWTTGTKLKLSYHNLEGVSGAEAFLEQKDYYGRTWVKGGYQVPYWETTQGVTENGTKDHITFGRDLQVTDRLLLLSSFGLNRYGLDDKHNLTHSYSIDLGGRYNLPELSLQKTILGEKSQLALSYLYHVERVTSSTMRQHRDGYEYAPFALSDTESHTILLVIGKEFTKYTYGELQLGYGYDFVPDSGGFVGGGALYTYLTKNLLLELSTSYTILTGKTWVSGLSLRYTF